MLVNEFHALQMPVAEEDALEHFLGNWVWRAVHALLEHPEFQGQVEWLMMKLSVQRHEIEQAIDGLKELGLIRIEGDRIVLEEARFLIPPDKNQRSHRIQKHRLVSTQILNRMRADSPARGMVHFITAKAEDFNLCFSTIAEHLEKLSLKPNRADDELFGVTLSLAQLSQSFGKIIPMFFIGWLTVLTLGVSAGFSESSWGLPPGGGNGSDTGSILEPISFEGGNGSDTGASYQMIDNKKSHVIVYELQMGPDEWRAMSESEVKILNRMLVDQHPAVKIIETGTEDAVQSFAITSPVSGVSIVRKLHLPISPE